MQAISIQTISSKAQLKSHAKSLHQKKDPMRCEKCDFSCRWKYNLRKHTKSSHKPEKKEFLCKECDYTSKSSFYLERHLMEKHGEGEGHAKVLHKCLECPYRSIYAKTLQRHQETKHKEKG